MVCGWTRSGDRVEEKNIVRVRWRVNLVLGQKFEIITVKIGSYLVVVFRSEMESTAL